MKKTIRAVRPFLYNSGSNFMMSPYNAWCKIGGKTATSHYPFGALKSIAYKVDFPTICSVGDAKLRFVESGSISFDAFPDYLLHEIIPIIWDCWPNVFYNVAEWIKKHNVKCAIFTSSVSAKKMNEHIPDLNILTITEGINTNDYYKGDCLSNRNIDLLEYGMVERNFFKKYVEGIKHINCKNARGRMKTFDSLLHTISDAKIVIALPRCDVDPVNTGGQETLTQRFWEGMLSRCVLLGRAPKELVELIGYNPVINLDKNNPDQQVRDILAHIEDYQELVDKNRETALRMAPWEIRMKQVMEWLTSLGYEV